MKANPRGVHGLEIADDIAASSTGLTPEYQGNSPSLPIWDDGTLLVQFGYSTVRQTIMDDYS